MAEKTLEGITRVFELFGLSAPTGDRLERILNDSRSYTEIRDDLFDFAINRGGDTANDMISAFVRNRFAESGLDPATGDETAEERIARIANEIINGERTLDEVSKTIRELSGDEAPGPETDGEIDGEADDSGEPEADPEIPGVMTGGTTIKVGDNWYQSYEFPPGSGNFMVFQFNNREQVEETFGEIPEYEKRTEEWLNKHGIVQASAEEIIGDPRDFPTYTDTLMREAAVAAGIRDPSLVGRIANDPEMQQIMAQAAAGDWTAAQILAEQRQTDFWKNELYPGIENFYDRTDNPEQAYRDYIKSVSQYLDQLGYERGPDGTFKNEIERMLDRKIEANVFISQVPVFVRATQNAEFAEVLNEWAERELNREVEFDEWFDLMEGTPQPELEEVAERAMLAYNAQVRETGISDEQIEMLAERSQLSEAEAIQAFSEFNRSIIATDSFRRSKFNEDDLLRAMAGIDPQQGSIEEVRLEVAKIAREEALFDDEKINFYVGFDQGGRPVRPGLQSLAPESA